MRVALVGDYPVEPKTIRNGPQAVFSYLLEGLRQLPDLDIHVVTASKHLDRADTYRQGGVTFHYVPYPRLPAELSFFMLRPVVRQILHDIQPDLVHGQSGHRYGAMCLNAGFPTILTCHNVHGAEVPFNAGRLNRLRLALHFAISRRYFLAHVRHIVSISPYIRQAYEPLVNATFYDIDNPISDAFFELDPEYEIPHRVLFVGMLRSRKRPDRALRALALAIQEVPQLHLHLAGATVDATLHRDMLSFIGQHHLEDNVKFLGHLGEDQILDCYQNAAIFLLTSDLETSPMVVQQALAAGKPVVVTDAGGTRYLVDEGRTGFVAERENVAGLAEALVKLANDDGLRRRVGSHARQAALGRFRGEVVAPRIFQAYRDVLANENHHDTSS